MPGYVEVVDGFQVSGWCLEAKTQMPDRVVIYVDDEEVAQVPCHLPRSDLKNLGLGTGYGGYLYLHPSAVDYQKVTVRALSSGELLLRVADATKNVSPFQNGSSVDPINAVFPQSAPVPTIPATIELRLSANGRTIVRISP